MAGVCVVGFWLMALLVRPRGGVAVYRICTVLHLQGLDSSGARIQARAQTTRKHFAHPA